MYYIFIVVYVVSVNQQPTHPILFSYLCLDGGWPLDIMDSIFFYPICELFNKLEVPPCMEVFN